MTLNKLTKEILKEFDEKINDGFIVYVEGYDNQDFDVDRIKSFLTTSLSRVVQEIKENCVPPEVRDRNDEDTGWNECRAQFLQSIQTFIGENKDI